MPNKIRAYESDTIRVLYDFKRCIHAEECVRRLSQVFNRQGRPWVQPQHSTADEIAETIEHCPTGALQYERKDGGAAEAIPQANTIRIAEDGPLYLRGSIRLIFSDGTVHQDTRIALCRCGQSQNKPFCDNAHLEAGFRASGGVVDESKIKLNALDGDALFQIEPGKNGPIHAQGNFEIIDSAGHVVFRGTETWLCRCGGSGNKPFCDSTHKRNGFVAD